MLTNDMTTDLIKESLARIEGMIEGRFDKVIKN